MSAKPLWRGPTLPFTDMPGWEELSYKCLNLDVPPGTEVEVWPAGDRTPVTREQIRKVIARIDDDDPGGDEGDSWLLTGEAEWMPSINVDALTDAVLALLSGVPTETDAT